MGQGAHLKVVQTMFGQALRPFSEKTTPVWDIHFPAITICPETKVAANKLNFTAEMNALLEDYKDINGTTERES